MYIYNISFMVEGAVQERWLQLMRRDYIPFLKKEGFDRITFSRVLSSEVTAQLTYSLQVLVDDIPQYQRLCGELFAEYTAIASEAFGTQVLYFSTLMKIVETE